MNADAQRLDYLVHTFLGVPAATFRQEPIPLALAAAGIITFNGNFVGISATDIDTLTYIPHGTIAGHVPLGMVYKRQLKMLLAFLHHKCRIAGRYVNIAIATRLEFNNYRVGTYNPDQDIVPWNAVPPNNTTDELSSWNRTVKPSRNDYKPFKDATNWTRYKESVITTLDSHGLTHLIDPVHVSTNAKLDTAQQKWLYKTFQDCLQHANARAIVTNHLTLKNTT